MRIAVIAAGSPIAPEVVPRVQRLVETKFSDRGLDVRFHPQCVLAAGHFAGDDETRAAAFLDAANDDRIDAVWFARGGYGSNRIAPDVLPKLTQVARDKTYLGYSDAGFLLAGMYKRGFRKLVHGPMPGDILRDRGERAVERALRFLLDAASDALEPSLTPASRTAAFNTTILTHILGTPLEPDLTDHVLMLEEIGEEKGRLDQAMFQIVGNAGVKRVAGIRLGRCHTAAPRANKEAGAPQYDYGHSEEEIVSYWCRSAGIRYLGRADIGHDADNKIVPFGSAAWAFETKQAS